jgi:plasmid stability protein
VYDRTYAYEAFRQMDAEARKLLWNALNIYENNEAADIPAIDGPDAEDFLWEELLDSAREDGNLLSFFVVTETKSNEAATLYVSPDWPSAEVFAKNRIVA